MPQPKPRSKAKQRIINAAFEIFFTHGYEGAALSDIANAVGIRKPSLYTHFSSKDAIFAELLADALDAECTFIKRCFHQADGTSDPGIDYCHAFEARYHEAVTLRFLIRMAYNSPVHSVDIITSTFNTYIQILTEHIQVALMPYQLNDEQHALYTDAYLGIIDSLSVELLYDARLYQRRLKAMLMLYHNAIAQLQKPIP